MTENLRLMCVFAHPDDEALGLGPLLAKCAAEGVATYLLTATRGERGWAGVPATNPGLAGLGQLREAELRAAAQTLGVREVSFLDYIDGDLDQADPAEAIAKIVQHLRRVRPQVVVTFGPEGAYGHPDHIAISQLTTAALVCAADADYGAASLPPHRVLKLYFMVDGKEVIREFEAVVGKIAMTIDGVERCALPWEDWAITTRVPTLDHWRTAWAAIMCHATQVPTFAGLAPKVEELAPIVFREQTLYRALSLVNGGRQVEHDVFAGIRPEAQ